MADRIPLDELTSDQLKALYDERDQLRAAPTPRSAVLREAADAVARHTGNQLDANVKLLRRMADDAARIETRRWTS